MDGQEYHTLSDSKFVEISNDDLIQVNDAVAGTIYIKKKRFLVYLTLQILYLWKSLIKP